MTRTTEQRGSIMVLVMVLLIALLSAGAVAVGLLVADTRSATIENASRTTMYCAEAGLEAACPAITLGRSDWNGILDGSSIPAWYDTIPGAPFGIEGDIDANGTMDYRVTIMDNPEADGDPTVDSDNRIYIVSRCIQSVQFPRTLLMMIESTSGSRCPPGNPGGCYNDENRNSGGAVVGSCSKF